MPARLSKAAAPSGGWVPEAAIHHTCEGRPAPRHPGADRRMGGLPPGPGDRCRRDASGQRVPKPKS